MSAPATGGVYLGPCPTGLHEVSDELAHTWTVDVLSGLWSCPERGVYDLCWFVMCREYRVPRDQVMWMVRAVRS